MLGAVVGVGAQRMEERPVEPLPVDADWTLVCPRQNGAGSLGVEDHLLTLVRIEGRAAIGAGVADVSVATDVDNILLQPGTRVLDPLHPTNDVAATVEVGLEAALEPRRERRPLAGLAQSDGGAVDGDRRHILHRHDGYLVEPDGAQPGVLGLEIGRRREDQLRDVTEAIVDAIGGEPIAYVQPQKQRHPEELGSHPGLWDVREDVDGLGAERGNPLLREP